MPQYPFSTGTMSLNELKAFAAKLTTGSLMLWATQAVIVECEQRAQQEHRVKNSMRNAWD
ncbi:hypothetical protein [Cupriavidus sp. H39]|uniref:hypothetical protein n=1 Tax=Cupriavidus sp. H39 TaxID=3401635 RepID=UPI003D005FCB